MLCIDSNIAKSIFSSVIVGESLRITHSSLLYKDFNEKAIELLNRMKAQGAQSLTCIKALSKIIRGNEKAFAKVVMKFFLNFRFKLNKIYYLTHGTLSEVLYFCYIYFSRMTLCQQCSLFLRHESLSIVFFILWHMKILSSFFFFDA